MCVHPLCEIILELDDIAGQEVEFDLTVCKTRECCCNDLLRSFKSRATRASSHKNISSSYRICLLKS